MSEARRFGHHDYKRVRRAHANLAGLDQQECEGVLSLLRTERDDARAAAVRETREVLREVHSYFEHIAAGTRGSIGSVDNVYLPQLSRPRFDALLTKVRALSATCQTADALLHDSPEELHGR